MGSISTRKSYKLKYIIILTLLLLCSIFVKSSADTSLSWFELYDESYLSKYYKDINIDSTVFNDIQIRINSSIYAQTAYILREEHYNICYDNINTNLFKSFKEYYNPFMIMAYTVAEYGGHSTITYSFCPAICTRDLNKAEIDWNNFNPLKINSDFYIANGIKFSDSKYYGPLQIDKSYFTTSADYKCNFIPMDYWCWCDIAQWTFHNKASAIKNSWNSSYTFKNEYEVLTATAIAHNTGPAFMTSKGFTSSNSWYPWKNSQAVFDYISFISSDIVVDNIKKSAIETVQQIKQQISKGNTAYFGKSLYQCRKEFSTGVDWSLYINPIWLNNYTIETALSGSALYNWEKVLYPLQIIYDYEVLRLLYGGE